MLADRVIFIDGEAIIVDKPSGMPVDEPRSGKMSVQNHLESLTFGFQRWPVTVHRLDQDTSGCLLLARNPKSAKRFTQAFENREVTKRYVAVLNGVPEGASGTIDLPLAKVSSAKDGWRMTGDPAGKSAVTHWRVLAEQGGQALVEFTPETGRTHQIRVHAKEGLGIPIVGDPVYGKGEGKMMLHAQFISLARGNKPPVEATAPLPEHFTKAGWVLPKDADAGTDD